MKKVVLLLAMALFASPAFAEIKVWEDGIKSLTFKGDFRLRYEDETKSSSSNTKHRERFRLRFGLKYQASEHVSAGFRLATGETSDHSTHDTFGDSTPANFGLDQAWIQYKRDQFKMILGKKTAQQKQFSKAWIDGDYNPEGMAFAYNFGDKKSPINVHAAQYVVNNQSYNAPNDNAMMVGADAKFKFSDVKLGLTFGSMSVTEVLDATQVVVAGVAPSVIPGGTAAYSYVGLETKYSDFTLGLESYNSNVSDAHIGAGASSADKAGMVTFLKYKINDTYAVGFMSYDLGVASLPMMGAWSQDDFPNSTNIAGTKLQFKYKGKGMNIDLNIYNQSTKNSSLVAVDQVANTDPLGSQDAAFGTNNIVRTQVNFNVPF